MYMQKNEIFLNFVRDLRGFASKEREDLEILREFNCGDIAIDRISIRGSLGN